MRQGLVSMGTAHEIEIGGEGEALTAIVDGVSVKAEIVSERQGSLVLRIEGRTLAFDYAADEGGGWLCNDGRVFRFDKPLPKVRRQREAAETRDEVQRSPMPALVVAIEVEEGQEVEGGKTLLVLEAMKMETRVSAPPGSWKVARLLVAAGQQVGRDQELVELAPRPKAGTPSPRAGEGPGGENDR